MSEENRQDLKCTLHALISLSKHNGKTEKFTVATIKPRKLIFIKLKSDRVRRQKWLQKSVGCGAILHNVLIVPLAAIRARYVEIALGRFWFKDRKQGFVFRYFKVQKRLYFLLNTFILQGKFINKK